MTRAITIGSLFSGIGGLELGMECALRDGGFSVETTWQCEADAWCRGILARHWPAAARYTDVRGVGADAPRVDILCGGFPCQDVSYAGKGAGLAGERSGLWFEFARVVRDLRPRVVVVENVAALAARGLDAVLGSLSEAGYDAIWFDVRASDVGAPHRRERLFIVAWKRDVGHSAGAHRSWRSSKTRSTRDAGRASDHGDVADALCEHAQRRGRPHAVARGVRGRVAESSVGRAADGLPGRMDLSAHRWPVGPGEAQPEGEPPRVTKDRSQRRQRLRALGNAVLPQVSYVVGCVVARVLHEVAP